MYDSHFKFRDSILIKHIMYLYIYLNKILDGLAKLCTCSDANFFKFKTENFMKTL